MKRALTCAKVLLLAAALPAFAADEPSAARDLVVYGATPDGISAALEAKRHGLDVILLGAGKGQQLDCQ